MIEQLTEITPIQRADTKPSSMLSRNVRIRNRRTSVRLEQSMWAALNEIAHAEKCTIHDLCAAVHDMKEEGLSFTAALRVFLMEYYRTVANASPQVSMVQKTLRQQDRPHGRLSAMAG